MNYLCKIPQDTRNRLDGYVNSCFCAGEELYLIMISKISAVMAVLYDCGYLSMEERANASVFYRTLAKEEYEKGTIENA